MTKNLSVLITLLILLGGCVSVGTQVKQEQLSGFTKGSTTYEDVVSRLGPPNTVNSKSDGTRMAIYTYVHSQSRPESFIPLVGAFVGGADSKMNMATFTFDQDSKLLEYSLSESSYGAGTGFAAGTYRDPHTDQPKEVP